MSSLPLSEVIQRQQSADTKSWCSGVLLVLRYCPEADLLPTAHSKIRRGWELQSRRADGWQSSLLALWRNWKGSFTPLFGNSFSCQG